MNFRDPKLIKDSSLHFVRHNISFHKDKEFKKFDKVRTENALKNAWANNYVLIDYKPVTTFEEAYDPNFYSGYKSAQSCIARFNTFLDTGGFIVIACNSTNPGELKAGYVRPKSKGLLISEQIGETYIFKGIKLEDGSVETFNMSNAPGLFSAIVRQQTFCTWDVKRQFEFSYLKTKPDKLEINDFHHKQLEVLCMEYLRSYYPEKSFRLDKQTMPLGGSLANVDIVGIDKSGHEVLAQVTFRANDTEKEGKLRAVLNSGKPQKGYYFGNVKNRRIDTIEFININDVLNCFVQYDSAYLYKMLGF